jgi:hypothetical protein
LDLKLAYWVRNNKDAKKADAKEKGKKDEQRELKSFQFVAMARLASTAVALGGQEMTRDTLTLVAQPRDRKKVHTSILFIYFYQTHT